MPTFRIETEEMVLTNYRPEANSFASNGLLISLGGGDLTETGTASFDFLGDSGLYDVVVGYFDEADGVSTLEVSKQGTLVNTWDLNQSLGSSVANSRTQTQLTIATRLSINSGETIEIRGREDQGEPARIDFIEFISVSDPNVSDAPLRIEAERMTLSSYRLELGSFASGGQFIGLVTGGVADTGIATFNFSGNSGLYDVVVRYFDETDGVSNLEVRKQGVLINAWDFNQNRGSTNANAQTGVQRTIATQLLVNQGETIQLQGRENNGEPARIDYIEFVPVSPATINGTAAGERLTGDAKNNTINGFGGNDTLIGGAGDDNLNGGNGIDTASYAQANSGIIANLSTGIVLAPIYGTLAKPKIMPLGDSITAGQHTVEPTPGGYRIQMWQDFTADNLSVDFVGSQSNGPASLGDRNHEGHGGWTIAQINSLVTGGLLSTYQPDTILLQIGTNDTRFSTLSGMYANLSNLIDQIATRSPNTQLLVSSIPPIDSTVFGQARSDLTRDFNALIPYLVNDKVAQGKKVTFANVGGSLTLSDLVSDGLHPSAGGYNKMGDAWYDAIADRDTLTSIENITGTAFNDNLRGNANANVIQGNSGNDTLTGGAGADIFVYTTSTQGRDAIADFSINDFLRISASGFGGGLVAGTALSTTASATGVFVSSATPTPLGSSANFLYNTTTGLLNFDSDGTGANAALPIAMLTGSPLLSNSQFIIVT